MRRFGNCSAFRAAFGRGAEIVAAVHAKTADTTPTGSTKSMAQLTDNWQQSD